MRHLARTAGSIGIVVAVLGLAACATAEDPFEDGALFGQTDWIGEAAPTLTSGRPDGSDSRRIGGSGNASAPRTAVFDQGQA
jgi:hypothetical protein